MKRLSVLQKYPSMLQLKTVKMQRWKTAKLERWLSSVPDQTYINLHSQSVSGYTFMNLSDTLSNYSNDSIR